MKKIAVVEMSFHKKTKSFDFFKNLLAAHFEIREFFDDNRQNGKEASIQEINEYGPDVVLYCQFIHSPHKILKLRCRNLVWVPMFDGERLRSYLGWMKYVLAGVKVLCLSQTLFAKVKHHGFVSLYKQYCPDPAVLPLAKGNDRHPVLFFWPRSKISWEFAKTLIGHWQIAQVFFKNDPDPDNSISLPSEEDIKKFNIRIMEGWLSREEYLALLSSSDIFLQAREYEGVGISFLEAMAMGLCVIAPDRPTMNEYIKDGFNGCLFDPDHPHRIAGQPLKEVSHHARESMREGYEKWRNATPEIIDFISRVPVRGQGGNRLVLKTAILIYDALKSLYRFVKRGSL